ncbi:MAG TPA: 5-oxoprolinase subunit PxpB [Candidatus Sulfopaludibacter sp.]|nr:5-oxoprolinase subunit PxpB [Candidatus Sulfopaludibacter sp.]
MIIRPASDRSLLVTFGDEISLAMHRQVMQLTRILQGVRGILNLHPAFSTVLIDFDPRLRTHAEIEGLVQERWAASSHEPAGEPRLVEIPVLYGAEFGPDLEDVARHNSLTPERVVEMHAGADYVVYFVGFSTCFPYLGGLPAELATPRLAAPRKLVPEGSIGIAGAQTGVYPLASPGGWRLIGRTQLKLFDVDAAPPAYLRMGDRVRFVRAPGSPL